MFTTSIRSAQHLRNKIFSKFKTNAPIVVVRYTIDQSGTTTMARTPQGKRNLSDASAIARRLVEDPKYQQTVHDRALMGNLPPQVEMMLWHYAFGKPPDVVELDHSVRRDLSQLTDEELARRAEAAVLRLETAARTNDLFDDPGYSKTTVQ